MPQTTIQISVPKAVADFLSQMSEKDRTALLLYPYVKNGTLSHGRAAEMLGMHKLDLIQLYNDSNLPYLELSAAEVKSDIENCMAAVHAAQEREAKRA